MNVLPGLTDWVLTQKRVTNKKLRDRFDLIEEEADDIYYHVLKPMGMFTTMGHVNHDWNDDDLLCLEKADLKWRAFKPSKPQDTVAYFETLEEGLQDIKSIGLRVMYEVSE